MSRTRLRLGRLADDGRVKSRETITESRQPCSLQNIPTIPRFDADHATDIGGVEVKCISK